jgi:hypothetical protein
MPRADVRARSRQPCGGACAKLANDRKAVKGSAMFTEMACDATQMRRR